MQQRASEEVRQRWKENILKQRDSGISVAAWCRQHNLPVHAFFYWRDKFFPSKAITRSDFREVKENQQISSSSLEKAGVCLEYREIRIDLDRSFDFSCLKQCLKAIREI